MISKTGALLHTAANTTNNQMLRQRLGATWGPREVTVSNRRREATDTENRSQGEQGHPPPQNHVPSSLSTRRTWHSVGKRGGCRSSRVGTGRKTVHDCLLTFWKIGGFGSGMQPGTSRQTVDQTLRDQTACYKAFFAQSSASILTLLYEKFSKAPLIPSGPQAC